MRLHVSRTLGSLVLALTLAACGGGGDAGSAPIPTGTVVLSEGTFASHNGSFVGETPSATSVSVNGTTYDVIIEPSNTSDTAQARVIYNAAGNLIAIGIDLNPSAGSNGDHYYCHNVDGPTCPAGITLETANQIIRFNNALIQEEQGGGRTIRFNGSLKWQLPA